MIHKVEIEALAERAHSLHVGMPDVCKEAKVFPQSWYRARKRGSMEYGLFRRLDMAMKRIAIRGVVDDGDGNAE